MHEEQLSPLHGRLIDAAKAAAALASPRSPIAEGVAVLTESGAIFTGHTGENRDVLPCGAVEQALRASREAGGGGVCSVALASGRAGLDSVFPCPDCYRALTQIDPELPMVVMQLGRWVLIPLSRLAPPSQA